MTADAAEPAPGAPSTIRSLHVLAEHVLGAGLYAATGHIGLQVAPGGFATPSSADGELAGRLAVSRGRLLITRPDGSEQQAEITTPAAAAAFFGVDPGMPSSVYTPATDLVLDASLEVDRAVAEQVGQWFELGDEALARLAAAHAAEDPTGRTLWPEHFDLSLSMAEVNYGASPGDDLHPEPYLYVGPWTPHSGAFWNEPFGASVPASQVASVDDALAFYAEGHDRAADADR
ncbi:MAG: hypothetical protein ACXWA3_16820 [Acidimicrobiales bacterium]